MFVEKASPLPPGDESVVVSYHGFVTSDDAEARHVVYLGIGRPAMQETENGEMLAVHVMTPEAALKLARSIIKDTICVLGHAAGKEDCSDVS